MAPRVLKRGPDYTLDVKTRVPTGSIQRTQQPNLTPAPDTGLSETFDFLGGLARIGYSLKGFFNQNNQRNADKNWNDMLPSVQETYNFMDTQDIDNLPNLNTEALKKYQDHINNLDYNKKTKDKMLNSLSDYSARKMEQIYSKGLSENEVANITNLNIQTAALVKEEDINGALRLINNATFNEDAWLNEQVAQSMRTKVISTGNFEISKNDMLELDYTSAYDILTNQAEDENGDLYYPHNPQYPELSELTVGERVTLEKTIAQAATFEEKRKSIAEYEASNAALNSLFSDEISVADFMSSENPDLDTVKKIDIVNVYEAQQRLEVVRLDSIVAEPLRKGINDGKITNPDTIRAIDDPDLTEKTRAELIRSLETGTVSVDPYKEALRVSAELLNTLMTKAAQGDEPLNIMRSGLRLLKQEDMNASDYNKLKRDVENTSGLQKLTSIMSGASKDPRFQTLQDPTDAKKLIQDPEMFDEFARLYPELFYNQINEQDPEKQMNIDEFRSMADKLIDTIADEKRQKDFRKISVSKQNVGTGLLVSWGTNKMEAAVNSLNEGMYDAMKYIEPEAWSQFKRKMITQWELIKGETYNEELRLYKDKIPVFLNKDGEEEMLIIENGFPQLVSMGIGLDKHKNLALGYSVGDKNPENETMLSTGWFRIIRNSANPANDTIDTFGSAYGGQVFRPKGEEEFYIVTDTLSGVVVRPYHGDPTAEEDIAAAVKEVTNPTITLDEDNEALNAVDKAMRDTALINYYQIRNITPPNIPEVPLTPAQKAQQMLLQGRP